MKKQTLLIFALLLSSVLSVNAQEATSSSQKNASSSSSIKEDVAVKNLKEKLATYTEAKRKDQKAVSGVCKLKDNKVLIKDNQEDKEYTIKIDDALTKIYQITGSSKKEIKKSDIKDDAYVIASGPIIDTTVDANTVYLDEEYVVSSGKVTEVNKGDYYIKIMSPEKEEYTLDIESFTKQNLLNIKTLEIEKTGFSKVKEGDTIHFAASKQQSSAGKESSPNRFAAQKILIIPQEFFIK